MEDIFISYSRQDLSIAKALAARLEGCGWSVWWDHHMQAGNMFGAQIEQKLIAARCVIVLWTPHSVNSRHVFDEATEALNMQKLIPVQAGSRPPIGFRGIHCVMWNDDDIVQDEEFAELLRQVKPLLGDSKGSKIDLKMPHVDAHKQAQAEQAKSGQPAQHDPAKIRAVLLQNKDLQNFHISPGIDPAKENNARASCNIPETEQLLGLLDLTVFGSADDCVAFTSHGFYHRNYDGEIFSITYPALFHTEVKIGSDSLFIKTIVIGKQELSLGGITFSVQRLTRMIAQLKVALLTA